MEGILKVTTEQLTATANEFSTCGSSIRNLTASMTETVKGLSASWSGEAASAYLAKFNSLQADINQMHSMIQEHVADLTQMASLYAAGESGNASTVQGLASNVIL